MRSGVSVAMEYIRAFFVGGLICMLVQILMDKTKMMPGRIMVLLVVSGSVLGFLGVYEPFAEWAGAGDGPARTRSHYDTASHKTEKTAAPPRSPRKEIMFGTAVFRLTPREH